MINSWRLSFVGIRSSAAEDRILGLPGIYASEPGLSACWDSAFRPEAGTLRSLLSNCVSRKLGL